MQEAAHGRWSLTPLLSAFVRAGRTAARISIAVLPLLSVRAGAEPGEVFRDRLADGSPGPQMVWLPAGEFRMGDLDGKGDPDEGPVRRVRLARPVAIGLHEVTFDEYERYCRDSGTPVPDDSGFGRGSRPVVNVAWQDAVAYGVWLSEQTGRRYRLPTEAEWEYAARGGTSSRFWWGDGPARGRANCAGCGSPWDSESTAPVGRTAPNPFGLFDVLGNVWEWVADCYNNSYRGVPDDGTAHVYRSCGQMVVRGGSWILPAREMRASNRWRWYPVLRSDEVGFRIAREPD